MSDVKRYFDKTGNEVSEPNELERIILHLDYATKEDEDKAIAYLRTLEADLKDRNEQLEAAVADYNEVEAECRWAMEILQHDWDFHRAKRAQAWLDAHKEG